MPALREAQAPWTALHKSFSKLFPIKSGKPKKNISSSVWAERLSEQIPQKNIFLWKWEILGKKYSFIHYCIRYIVWNRKYLHAPIRLFNFYFTPLEERIKVINSMYFGRVPQAPEINERPKKGCWTYDMVFWAFPENFMKIGWE